MKWDRKDTEKLIKLYRDHRLLYDKDADGFYDAEKRNQAWLNITKKVKKWRPEATKKELAGKMHSLIQHYTDGANKWQKEFSFLEEHVQRKVKQNTSWSSESTKELIRHYEAAPELWDATHKLRSKKDTEAAFEKIASQMEKSVGEVKQKIRSLKYTFQWTLNTTKTRESKGIYKKPSWEFFEDLLFLYTRAHLTHSDDGSGGESQVAFDEQDCQAFPHIANLENLSDVKSERKFDESTIQQIKCESSEIGRTEHVTYDFQPNEYSEAIDTTNITSTNTTTTPQFSSIEDLTVTGKFIVDALEIINKSYDEYDSFGQYVTCEIRSLCSNNNQKKLRCFIEKAIVDSNDIDDIERTVSSSTYTF